MAIALLPLQGLALTGAATDTPPAVPVVRDDTMVPAALQGPAPRDIHEPIMRTKGEDPGYERFAERWPAQAAATEDPSQPDTTRWALLIGINVMLGSVADNVGSRQDATDLYQFLIRMGWRDENIVLITDTDATRENIMAGMTWLATKTSPSSVAVLHYSGHSKKWYGKDHDGDGEVTDEGLWPTDDQFIVDSEMVRQISGVRAGKFWISIGACNSAGFNDPGLQRAGRLLTFSSAESEKSYEDPSLGNSVYGYYMFDEGMLQGFGDSNRDGRIGVEETFRFAAPRATTRSQGQRYGAQRAVIIDQVEGDFDLAIPAPAPPPQQEPEPEQPQESERGGVLCPVICSRDD